MPYVPNPTSGNASVGNDLIITEVHADPSPDEGDANGDGTIDSGDDEFVEIVNEGDETIDLSGYSIEDNTGERFTFPDGATLAPGVAATIFGGGDPTGIPGEVFTSYLGLNNGGDTVILKDASGARVDAMTYGSEGGDDQSLTRSPSSIDPFVQHMSTSSGLRYSPGQSPDGSPLPVELTSFNAVTDGGDVTLRWRTITETNNSGFEVQQRTDQGFTQVGFVEGAGTTVQPQSYQYQIQSLDAGTHIFRLKQVDFDGTPTYTRQVEVTVALDGRFKLGSAYPNPFQNDATFSLQVRETQEVRITVFNALGQQVLPPGLSLVEDPRRKRAAGSRPFDAEGLARRVVILGATGSIGRSTLDLVRRHPERLQVTAVTAHTDVAGLAAIAAECGADLAVIADPQRHEALRNALADHGADCETGAGAGAVAEAAGDPGSDTVVAGIVGGAGLTPALAAARAGKRILLANKEALVMAGPLFMAAARTAGAVIMPVDSEHNAIFQALPGDGHAEGVRRITLTASGGPFRDWTASDMAAATPDQACAHPNWSMGRKISVDSATLMNKGLEVIEASYLFDLPGNRIDVLIHPESIVHGLVEYADGSVLAQLGLPDMRTPLACGLFWPERAASGVESLDLAALGRLHFESPDPERFPCLGLATAALDAGGLAPVWLNAGNEVAVQAFLDGRIGFGDITVTNRGVLDGYNPSSAESLEAIHAADRQAREAAGALIRDR